MYATCLACLTGWHGDKNPLNCCWMRCATSSAAAFAAASAVALVASKIAATSCEGPADSATACLCSSRRGHLLAQQRCASSSAAGQCCFRRIWHSAASVWHTPAQTVCHCVASIAARSSHCVPDIAADWHEQQSRKPCWVKANRCCCALQETNAQVSTISRLKTQARVRNTNL